MKPLSSDQPSIDPKDDLFGHAPFAEHLAKSIRRNTGEHGLVLALHGPWGSGKTTVLNYLCHFIETDQSTDGEPPVIVHFNPWWFSGRDNLAHAFLNQLQAVLPTKSEKLKQLGSLLGEFAEGIGGLIDLTGFTGGFAGLIGKAIGQISKQKPKDVPSLKAKICKILHEAQVRVLVIIDDIDRLDESEVRQLFTVIKALADFPFITYLLAFDREVAAKAIERESTLPGDRYLEKIIQVPFELPPVDKAALQNALFKKLDEVMIGTPDGLFDQSHWTNVYFEGIDGLIRVPRDIVRLTNTLSITYRSVVGEVNPVDFIAIEAIRVFLPSLYHTIRSHSTLFAGHRDHSASASEKADRQTFHEAWKDALPEEHRNSASELMKRLFPKLEDTIFGSDWLSGWRKELRICHPEVFPVYFRLSLPPGSISRRELLEIISSMATPESFKEHLLRLRAEKRPDGHSRVGAFLERLRDHTGKDIPASVVPGAIGVFLDTGDALIDPSDEQGMLSIGNALRTSFLVEKLLNRVEQIARSNILEAAISHGKGIAVQLCLLKRIEEKLNKSSDIDENALLSVTEVDRLKGTWLARIFTLSQESSFIAHPELTRLLYAWRNWSDGTDARKWAETVTRQDEGLLKFLTAFLTYTTSQTLGDLAVRKKPRLNPSRLEPYIDPAKCAERLTIIRTRGGEPEWATEAISQYLKEHKMLQEGKNPEAFEAFDDEEQE